MKTSGNEKNNPFEFNANTGLLEHQRPVDVQIQVYFMALLVSGSLLVFMISYTHPLLDLKFVPPSIGVVFWLARRAELINHPSFSGKPLIVAEAILLSILGGFAFYPRSSFLFCIEESIFTICSIAIGLAIATKQSRNVISLETSIRCWLFLLSIFALGFVHGLIESTIIELAIFVCAPAAIGSWIGFSTLSKCPVLLMISLDILVFKIVILLDICIL
jgi:hypothetical protein